MYSCEVYEKSKNVIPVSKDTREFYEFLENHLNYPEFRKIVSEDIKNEDFNTVYEVMRYAIGFDKVEMLRQIIDCGVDINHKSQGMLHMIFYAIEFGHVECAKLLIDNNADLSVTNHIGLTPYQYSVWCSDNTETFYPYYNSSIHKYLL